MTSPVALMGRVLFELDRAGWYCRRAWLMSRMDCGERVYIGPGSSFTVDTVSIGHDVYVGRGCCIQSVHGKIVIGSNVMLGPGVSIHGGDHRLRQVGRLIREATEKSPGEDGVVEIQDDCWIGAEAIILAGVTVGRGSVVGAGAIVTRDIPEYSVYTGAPERHLRPRFEEAELARHKALLGREDSCE